MHNHLLMSPHFRHIIRPSNYVTGPVKVYLSQTYDQITRKYRKYPRTTQICTVPFPLRGLAFGKSNKKPGPTNQTGISTEYGTH